MNNQDISEPRHCPSCGADLAGKSIPAKSRQYYGGGTNFKREIGLYAFDVTVGYACPDCDHRWPRPGFEDRFQRSGAASWPAPEPRP